MGIVKAGFSVAVCCVSESLVEIPSFNISSTISGDHRRYLLEEVLKLSLNHSILSNLNRRPLYLLCIYFNPR